MYSSRLSVAELNNYTWNARDQLTQISQGSTVEMRYSYDALNSTIALTRQCGTSMVTLDKVIRAVQVVLLAVSFMSWGNSMIAFGQFMREGSTKADVTHQIELNQHGSIAYITVHQSHVLTLWEVIAVSSFVVAALLDLHRRKRYPDPKER